MITHHLKTVEPHFTHVATGLKTFDLRKHDRPFAVGDVVDLLQVNGELKPTGRRLQRRITHLLTGPVYGLAEGWCVLSLSREEP